MPVPVAIVHPTVGIVRVVGENDEAVTSAAYATGFRTDLERIFFRSAYWLNQARFSHVRQQLNATASLSPGWDSHGADPPNAIAREASERILHLLETTSLPPARLTPTVEGGIALSFVEDSNRAVVEIYNTGEIAVATYSDHGEPRVWELEADEAALLDCIQQIRVHLAS